MPEVDHLTWCFQSFLWLLSFGNVSDSVHCLPIIKWGSTSSSLFSFLFSSSLSHWTMTNSSPPLFVFNMQKRSLIILHEFLFEWIRLWSSVCFRFSCKHMTSTAWETQTDFDEGTRKQVKVQCLNKKLCRYVLHLTDPDPNTETHNGKLLCLCHVHVIAPPSRR